MDVSLIVIHPDGSQHEVPIRRARQTIGRNKTCDLRVAVPEVSREHCELLVEGERLIIRDLGSSNGTFVNRHRVQETELTAGDVIAVGPANIVVRVDGQPRQVDSARVLAGAMGGGAGAGSGAPDRPTIAMRPAADAPAGSDDSSVMDFDFDLDDEDEQPKL